MYIIIILYIICYITFSLHGSNINQILWFTVLSRLSFVVFQRSHGVFDADIRRILRRRYHLLRRDYLSAQNVVSTQAGSAVWRGSRGSSQF